MTKYVITKSDKMLMWIAKRKHYRLFQLRDEIHISYKGAWKFSRKLEKMGFVKRLERDSGYGNGYKVLVRCENGKTNQ